MALKCGFEEDKFIACDFMAAMLDSKKSRNGPGAKLETIIQFSDFMEKAVGVSYTFTKESIVGKHAFRNTHKPNLMMNVCPWCKSPIINAVLFNKESNEKTSKEGGE